MNTLKSTLRAAAAGALLMAFAGAAMAQSAAPPKWFRYASSIDATWTCLLYTSPSPRDS